MSASGGQQPRIAEVEDRLNGLRKRPVPGRHDIFFIEQEAPGCFEIRCSCGDQTVTYWGEHHAAEIASLHIWSTCT